MKAGRLRHRIRLDEVTNGVDSFGAPQKTWTQIAEVAADISSIRGQEYFASGRDLGEEVYRIVIREVPGFHIDGTYRATDLDTGATYDITAVLESHMRNMLQLMAKAGSSHP